MLAKHARDSRELRKLRPALASVARGSETDRLIIPLPALFARRSEALFHADPFLRGPIGR